MKTAGARVSLGLLILVVVLASVAAYRSHVVLLPPFQADETGHALPAARMAIDLRHGDLAAFVEDTQREMLWPFLHPWYVTLFFLAFGTSTEVGRASSLAAFGLATVLSFLLTREVCSKEADAGSEPPVLLGWLAAGMMLASAGFWVLACRMMLESLGMAMTLGTLLAFLVAQRRGSVSCYAGAGLLAAATFLTKYNYGASLIAALLLSGVPGPAALLDRRRIALVAAFVLPILGWSSYHWPEKLEALYNMTLNRDEGLTGFSNVFFYPREMAALLGWPLAALLAIALLASVLGLRDTRLRPLVVFTVIGFTLITLHPNKQDRYMFTTLPVLYVLAELQLARWVGRYLAATQRSRFMLAAWAAIVLNLALFLNPAPALAEETKAQAVYRPAAAIMDFVLRSTGPDRRVLVLGSGGMLPHLLLEWEITSRLGIRNPIVELLLFPEGDHWDRYRTGYPTEMTPHYARVLEESLRQGRFDDVVTLRMTDDSVFNPDFLKRWDLWSQNYVTAMASQSSHAVAVKKDFHDDGILVRIYRPTTSGTTR